MSKRPNTTRVCLYLFALNLVLIFFLFFGQQFNLFIPGLGPAHLFLMILLVFFTCFALFVSFIEAETHAEAIAAMEDRLTDSFKYIGKINLLTEEFKDIFVPKKEFPDTKLEFKRVIKDYAERTLAISRQKWVAIRIIDSKGLNTAAEYWTRDPSSKVNFNNKDIVSGRCDCHVISTPTENLQLKAYCLLPLKVKEKEKASFILSMLGQLEMIMAIISHDGNQAHAHKKKKSR